MADRGTAVVVGVPAPSPWKGARFAPLRGVVNDATGMAGLLAGQGLDVTLCTEPAETSAAGIAERFLHGVEASRPGELFVAYFAGHGYRVPTPGEVEPNSEVLMCADGPIDDDITTIMRERLAASGGRLVMIVDACHADGFFPGPMVKALEPPTEISIRPGPSVIWWSAALAEEEAYEGADHGAAYGVFTHSLLRVWSTVRTSYRDLWRRLWTESSERFGSRGQTPLLRYEGPDELMLDAGAFCPD
jgi:Caspase domain